MKRITGAFMGICLAVLAVFGGMSLPVKAASGSISVSVSSKTVNIGDTITVTVSASSDVMAMIQVNVSCSGGAEYTGGGSTGEVLEPDAGGSDSYSLTYRATSPGTVTFTASVVAAYAVESQEAISIGGASGSVTVNNSAGGGGTGNEGGNGGGTGNEGGNGGGGNAGGNGGGSENNGEDNSNKSADNSLKSLTISPGTLSPAFKYSTTKYTASVASDVTSVAVDAQVSNSKASVESVTGNTDLKPGENTIKIVVKAENGVIATYTIVVTRGGAPSEEPTEEPTEENPTEPLPETGITIGGRNYKVSAAFPEGFQLPEEFEKITANYNGDEVEAYSFPYGSLKLYYLKEEVPEGAEGGQEGCYFYNEGADAFFPYIKVPVGNHYVIVLPSSYNEGIVPEGYEAAEVLFGESAMEGFQLSSLYTEGIDGAGDFYLVYGVNQEGIPGWYQYDRVEGSLQRFVQLGSVGQPEEEVEDESSIYEERYQKDYQELKEKYQKEKDRAHKMLCALILVIVVAVIVIINIFIFGRRSGGSRRKKKDKDLDIDFIDFDDL